MKTYNKIASVVIAGVMAASLSVCSAFAASSSSVSALVNAQLASGGSAYTVEAVSASTDSTVSLIEEAVATYKSYKNYLVDTDKLADKLDSDGESSGTINNRVNAAKQKNLKTKSNFGESLASFDARGMDKVYTVTDEQVTGGVENEAAVASYISNLVTGNAKIYVSDVVELPKVEDNGEYTGENTALRFIYVEY